jgi:hypothetical protein
MALGSWTGAYAERNLPPADPVLVTRNTASTNLPATYGAAGNQFSAAGVGHSMICVLTETAEKLYVTTSATTNCTGASDKWVVPQGGTTTAPVGSCFPNTRLNKNICLRSSSGTISSSTVIDLLLL